MKSSRRNGIFAMAAFVVAAGAHSVGGADATAPAAPSFQNMRFDDSQATREQSLVYTKLGLSDVSDLSIGGQARVRGEWWNNFNFGLKDPNDDAFALTRMRLHADLRACESFRIFAEARSAFAHERHLYTPDGTGKRPVDEDRLDLQNAFGDLSYEVGDVDTTLRLGRQEMLYGAQRLVGVVDWGNTRRTFDGAKAIAKGDSWQVDAFAVRPVLIQRTEFNDSYSMQDFYGIYGTKRFGDTGINVDAYLLDRFKHGTTNTVSDSRKTAGARVYGACSKSGVDYDVEGSHQFGGTGDGDIDAWAFASQLGYSIPDCPVHSRIYAGYDYGSGDGDAKDTDNSRFDPLYPTGHLFFGLIDVIGRQNIHDFSVGMSAKPAKGVATVVEGHWFERADSNDGVYDAGGNRIIAGSSGTAGTIGQEIDVTVSYKFDAHLTLAAGYGHFFASDVVKDAKGDDIDTAYVSGQYTF